MWTPALYSIDSSDMSWLNTCLKAFKIYSNILNPKCLLSSKILTRVYELLELRTLHCLSEGTSWSLTADSSPNQDLIIVPNAQIFSSNSPNQSASNCFPFSLMLYLSLSHTCDHYFFFSTLHPTAEEGGEGKAIMSEEIFRKPWEDWWLPIKVMRHREWLQRFPHLGHLNPAASSRGYTPTSIMAYSGLLFYLFFASAFFKFYMATREECR